MIRQEGRDISHLLEMLRSEMAALNITYYLAMSTDPHESEYVDDHFKVTEFFSGCSSDNATLIVEADSARLWTDGRYFISGARELEGSGIELMKIGEKDVPEVRDYLKKTLKKGQTIGFDGRSLFAERGCSMRKLCEETGVQVDSSFCPEETLWIGRPPRPCHEVWMLSEELQGMSFSEKLKLVREKMEELKADCFVLSKLDDIMWLFNIRGSDVECNPVALTYALIGKNTTDLFIQQGAVTRELERFAKEQHVKLHDYDNFFPYLSEYHFEGPVLLDVNETSDAIYAMVKEKAEIVEEANPTKILKAKKNPVELENIRRVYVQDSVQLCRFLFRMKKRIGQEEITELSAAEELDAMRAELPGFLDLSFPTISAYGPNAAMAHYAASEDSCAQIKAEGFYLVDSGGQYLGGTTDVTRTIACGPLTDEMRRDFTLVAAANLRLMDARFKKGTAGAQLDILAREPLYRFGLDYNHGTGHGIGYILNVHEGPQNISRSCVKGSAVPLEEGMLLSDEPGVYRENLYGIRTETILLCERDQETEFGEFFRFEPLTFVPIDLEAIDTRYLEPSDIALLNDYHRRVREVVAPYLEGEEKEALFEATREIRSGEALS